MLSVQKEFVLAGGVFARAEEGDAEGEGDAAGGRGGDGRGLPGDGLSAVGGAFEIGPVLTPVAILLKLDGASGEGDQRGEAFDRGGRRGGRGQRGHQQDEDGGERETHVTLLEWDHRRCSPGGDRILDPVSYGGGGPRVGQGEQDVVNPCNMVPA